mmetsp:Transcript_7840/g.16781  ORF Transcript_7840/g.16781 Transcript_7840/m.16781 type:complete len:87 (-) Transcript_7840:43-303(-)
MNGGNRRGDAAPEASAAVDEVTRLETADRRDIPFVDGIDGGSWRAEAADVQASAVKAILAAFIILFSSVYQGSDDSLIWVDGVRLF